MGKSDTAPSQSSKVWICELDLLIGIYTAHCSLQRDSVKSDYKKMDILNSVKTMAQVNKTIYKMLVEGNDEETLWTSTYISPSLLEFVSHHATHNISKMHFGINFQNTEMVYCLLSDSCMVLSFPWEGGTRWDCLVLVTSWSYQGDWISRLFIIWAWIFCWNM
jgi:hypothetical protein